MNRISRRHWFRTVACGATAFAATGIASPPRAPTLRGSVLDFGADPTGATDSSAAFQTAINNLDFVDVPAGTYQAGGVVLRGGTTLAGDGERSVIRQRTGERFAFTCDSGSSDRRVNLCDITVRDLQLRGTCDVDGFSEFVHLLSLNGVTRATAERVIFRGFRGDGLYIGSANVAGKERHNIDVVVRNCLFDGINLQNRNAISVIDCDGLLIHSCCFVDVTRTDMPGAIDLEPDANPFHVVRNLRITGNRFTRVGGAGSIVLYVPARLRHMPSNIVIEYNTIESTKGAAFVLVQIVEPPADALPQAIVIRGNTVMGHYAKDFELRGLTGVEILENVFEGATQTSLIGGHDPGDVVRDVTLRRNTFKRCGSEAGVGVSVADVDGLEVTGNMWTDCGNGAPASAVAFADGRSRRVVWSGNRFVSPNSRTR
jgi:hypothetical protein